MGKKHKHDKDAEKPVKPLDSPADDDGSASDDGMPEDEEDGNPPFST